MNAPPARPPIFPAPALRRGTDPGTRQPVVSADCLGTFRMGGRSRCAEVVVTVGACRFRVYVRSGRVVYPALRGEDAVGFTDEATRRAVESAALIASASADAEGMEQ